MKRIIIYTILVLITGTQSNLFAQNNNSLSGTITDKNTKQKISGATITIPDLHNTVLSDNDGNYIFTSLPAASYEVQVSVVGYKTKTLLITIKGVVTTNFELDATTTELPEVVVTGTSKAIQIKKSPLPILVINKDHLTTNISTNIIDAIAAIPGVASVTTGPNVSKPYIRGLGYNRMLTLFDGVRQEGQQWGDEHGIEIDKYLIDRVEVVKGPASLMYGSDALAGVVNLIPNQPAHPNKISGDATIEYQTNNGMYGGSAFLTGNKNGFEWGGRLSTRAATNYQNPVDGRVYNTGYKETAANAFIGLHKQWGYSHLNLSLYDNQQEIPDGSRDSLTRKFTKQITEADTIRPIVSDEELKLYTITPLHQRIQHYRAFLKNIFFFGNSRLSVNLGYQRSVRREYSHPEAPYQETPGLYLQLNTFNYDLKYFLPEYNKWAIVAGANGMYQTNNVTSGTEFVIPSYKQFDFGGFATIKKDFGKLNISGGLRYDVRSFSNDELYTKPNAVSGFDQPVTGADTVGADKPFSTYSKTFTGLSGSIGLAYSVTDAFTIKANIARGYRAPNISEISANGVHPGTGFYQIGNDNFKPEFSLQSDIGFLYSSKVVNTGASIFINQIDNYIYNTKLLNPDGTDLLTNSGGQDYPTYKYQQGKVVLYGAEANLDFHIIKPLHFENTFSVTYGDNKSYTGTEKNSTNKYVPFMPPLRYMGELRYDLAANSKLLTNSFIKLQVSSTASQDRVFTYNNTETATQGYTLVNLGAGIGFKNEKGKNIINVYILANNIFDVAYQDHLSRLKYFEQYSASPNGKLGIYNMGRNISLKIVVPF
jgi:iron complex outermembrane recepter protein